MSTGRLIEYHYRRLMSNHNINFIWYQFLWMIIGQSEELHSIYLNATILQEVNILGQILNTFCIPKTKVVVARDKYLVGIRQFDIPVQKVKHLRFRTIVTDVTAMHDDISLWHILYLTMQPMSIRQMEYPHICVQTSTDVLLRFQEKCLVR